MTSLFLSALIVILLRSRVKWTECASVEKESNNFWTSLTDSYKEIAYEKQRNSVLRVYASHVNKINIYIYIYAYISYQLQRLSCLTFYFYWKNPPVMSIIGNPTSKRVKFEGMAVDLAEYIAQRLDLTYSYCCIHLFLSS
jgi:hypothetical protein